MWLIILSVTISILWLICVVASLLALTGDLKRVGQRFRRGREAAEAARKGGE